MDSGSSRAAAGGGCDLLSSLDNSVLGHILSFLPAPEAARTAALSRRWRHVFAAVHTLSFDEADCAAGRPGGQGGDDNDDACSVWSDDYYNPPPVPRSFPAPPFATGILAAILGRHRGAAPSTPLRALRVKFDEFNAAASGTAVDAMISYAVLEAGDALHHIDLRFGHRPICNREYSLRRRGGEQKSQQPEPDTADEYRHRGCRGQTWQVPDMGDYVTPTSLCFCAALRTLRLERCRIKLPSRVALPSLDTLHLVRVTTTNTGGPDDDIQRLVSGCPRLTDLSLKACAGLTTLSVLEARLRTLALKCCHDLACVTVDSSELRTFKYRGAVPAPSFLSMRGPRWVSWCRLDFCGDEATDPAELSQLAAFLELFATAKYMRLKSARLGCLIGDPIFSSVPVGFPALRHLELIGIVPGPDTAVVATITRILEWCPSLETLSLFFMPEPVEADEERNHRYYSEEEIQDAHKLSYRYVPLPAPEGAAIPCLRQRTREINFVHYQGVIAQRLLVKFLLLNAPVVGEVCCEFAQGPLFIQTKLMEEVREWTMNKSAHMMFF